MADYGHELGFGTFITPLNQRPDAVARGGPRRAGTPRMRVPALSPEEPPRHAVTVQPIANPSRTPGG
jgi:hypothetical protein